MELWKSKEIGQFLSLSVILTKLKQCINVKKQGLF